MYTKIPSLPGCLESAATIFDKSFTSTRVSSLHRHPVICTFLPEKQSSISILQATPTARILTCFASLNYWNIFGTTIEHAWLNLIVAGVLEQTGSNRCCQMAIFILGICAINFPVDSHLALILLDFDYRFECARKLVSLNSSAKWLCVFCHLRKWHSRNEKVFVPIYFYCQTT